MNTDNNKELIAFEKYINELIRSWTGVFALLAAILIPVFFVLDYFTVTSDHYLKFISYRLTTTAFIVVIYFLIKYRPPSNFSFLYNYYIAQVITIAITQMTVDLGGFNSSYYAGLNLVIIASNLTIPWSHTHSAINGSITILIYIIMNAIWGGKFEIASLVNNLAFMTGTLIISVTVKYLNYQSMKKEFSLRFYLENLQLDEIAQIADIAKKVSSGNLSVQLHNPGNDSTDTAQSLSKSINFMIENLRSSLTQINSVSSRVFEYSKTIRENTQELSEGAKNQLQYTDESVKSTKRMKENFLQNSARISRSAQLSEEAFQTTTTNDKILTNSVARINRIDDIVKEAGAKVADLRNSSDKIGEIVQTIMDIADKTNLLSLNAAIEAARAGEMGRGFSVVSMEIGKLAEQTANATGETSALIKRLQKDVKASVESFSIITGEIGETRKMILDIADSMKKITDDLQIFAQLFKKFP